MRSVVRLTVQPMVFRRRHSRLPVSESGASSSVSARLRRRGRREGLFVLVGVGCLVGFVLLVVFRPSAGEVVPLPPADGGELPVVTVAPSPCDDAPADDGACRQEVPFPELLTEEAAAARLLAGSPLPEDVRFLLLSERDWGILFDDFLGAADLVPGGVFVPSGRMAAALEVAPAGFLWQQEWRGEGFVLVEQALFFTSDRDAAGFLAAWSEVSTQAGVSPFALGELVSEFADGRLGPGAVATAYVDEAAVGFFADRRCGADVVVAAGNVVFVVTFFEGAGCASSRLAPAPMVAKALRDRLLVLVEGV